MNKFNPVETERTPSAPVGKFAALSLLVWEKMIRMLWNPAVCSVAPSPRVFARRAATAKTRMNLRLARFGRGRVPGLDDGLVYPLERRDVLSRAAAVDETRVLAETGPPTAGNKEVLVLLVDFLDLRGKTDRLHYEKLLFHDGPQITLRSYYRRASGGQLHVSGKVHGWLTLPQPLEYYVGEENGRGEYPNNSQKLVEDALDLAEREGVDLTRFDADGDGFLDGLLLVFAGSGAEDAPDDLAPRMIWSHKWNLPKPRAVNDVTAWAYTLQPEDGRVGVFCHEFGHFLGLPDLYDESGVTSGVGDWCLMGYGSWGGEGDTPVDLSAWCRAQLGWTRPVRKKRSGALRMAPGDLLRLDPKGHETNEYFLLEMRLRDGLDAALPGEGLLIWHIDDDVDGNEGGGRHQVALMEADGRHDLKSGKNTGDDGDPYPGRTGNAAWNSSTRPSSRVYDGTSSGNALAEITFDESRVTARLTKRD